MLVVFCKPILDRGTRDYGMCDVNKASQCEHQATFKIVIAHSVVACSPDPCNDVTKKSLIARMHLVICWL